MTQIIEYSKHSDNYLVHHFEFECNDKTAIGKFAGNCSLNKFMSLNDWIQIFDGLNESVQNYVKKPYRRPAAAVRRIDDTNFELNVEWIEMDEQFYSKLLNSIDFNKVFPFVIKLKVILRSNIDKYVPMEPVTPVASVTKKKTPDKPVTAKKSKLDKSLSTTKKSLNKSKIADKSRENLQVSLFNGVHEPLIELKECSVRLPLLEKQSIELKECCVRLPLLEFDENGQVIQFINNNNNNKQDAIRRNKRKYSSIACDVVRTEQITSTRHEASIFMCSSSSTPFARSVNVASNRIDANISGTFRVSSQKIEKRMTNRLTTTPRSSNSRKGSLKFNPRIRLLKLPDDVNQSGTSKQSKKKNTGKKTVKAKSKAIKKTPKAKVRSIQNESELFEIPKIPGKKATETPKIPEKKAFEILKIPEIMAADVSEVAEKRASAKLDKKKKRKKEKPVPRPITLVKIEHGDMLTLTDEDIWKSFDDNENIILDLFHGYIMQTDPTVQKSNDYNNFDIISLVSTDQFSVMLDILFEKLVKIGEFGEISYDALFLELLIPEWILAIFMRRHFLDRESAIEKILQQKSNPEQSYEGYTSILTTKLDETMNNTKL